MHELEDPSLREKLGPHRRTTWIPAVEDGAGAPEDSRFGGAPWMRPGESWPVCGQCGQPLRFFLQINGRGLPRAGAQALEGGLLQFFYCTNDDAACSGWETWSPSSLVRLIPLDDLGGGTMDETGPEPFPVKRITGWTESADYPGPEEAGELGIEFSDEDYDALDEAGYPRWGEKLMGWPNWVQGVEYPDCPDCGTRMEMLFQVESESNIPWMWGDVGAGHITQCPRHHNRLTFGWACH